MISTLWSKRSWARSILACILGTLMVGCSSEPPPPPASPATAQVEEGPAAKKKTRPGKEDPSSPNYAEKPRGGGGK